MKQRYWITSIFILLLACAYFFNYFYQIEKTRKIKEIVSHQKIHAKQAAKSFNELFAKWNNVLFYLANDENVILNNTNGFVELDRLANVLKNEIKAITRTDKNGIIIFTTPQNVNVIGKNIAHQEHMVKILSDHKPVVSDVFDAVQGYKAIVMHYPVFKDGEFNGTVALLLNFEQITKSILDEIRIGKSGYAFMISSEGIELYCPIPGHKGQSIYETSKEFPELLAVSKQMMAGKEGTSTYTYDKSINDNKTVKKIVYYLPVNVNNTFWSLAVTYSEDEMIASLASFRNKLIILFAFIFLAGVYFSYFGFKAQLVLRESNLRKYAENKLKESEERYRTLIETTDTGYVVIDKAGTVIDANANYAQMAGYATTKDIKGRKVTDWTSPHDHDRYINEIQQCLETGSAKNIEIDYQHTNGTLVPVEINASLLQTKRGSLIINLCRDITDRRRADETLLKERKLLRTLIDNLPIGVFIKDKTYRKIIVNPVHVNSVLGHLKYLGMNTDIDILGKTDFEVFPKEYSERFYIDDQKIIRDGRTIINQLEFGLNPKGEVVWLLVSKVPLKDKNGDIIGMVGITTDITERKLAEEALLKAKEKAEESDRLKTAFLNNISHEIRTPLNAIIGFTGLLKENDLTDDKKGYYINIIEQSSNQLLSIITDIINIATIEAGQIKVNLSEVYLNNVFQLMYDQHKEKARYKNISLKYVATLFDKDAKILTDATKFTEILSNLINNAIKFTDQGYVKYGCEIKDNMLLTFVEDTGIGIKPEYQEIIFDRFKQADQYISSTYGGTGLGLSISKAYTEVLGGKIWLTSTPGVGSTFYFTIPLVRKEQNG